VTPIDLFGLGGADITASAIKEEYFLPAATVTWTFADKHAAAPARLQDHRPAPVPRTRTAAIFRP
jgi:hypothetical protein